MVIDTHRSNVSDLGGAILRKRFNVMEINLILVLNGVMLRKTVKHSVFALLIQYLRFLRIR